MSTPERPTCSHRDLIFARGDRRLFCYKCGGVWSMGQQGHGSAKRWSDTPLNGQVHRIAPEGAHDPKEI